MGRGAGNVSKTYIAQITNVILSPNAVYTRISVLSGYVWNIYAGQKRSQNKFQKIDITQNLFTDHRRMKLEINKERTRNSESAWKLSNILLNRSEQQNLSGK